MAKYKRKICANGGSLDDQNMSYNGNPVSDESKDMPKKKGVSANQALGYGQDGLNAYNQVNSVYSNPNATDAQKGDAVYGAGVTAVSAINPVIGGFIGLGDAIGKPIKTSVERTDASGNLKNEKAAQAGYIAGTFFNPAKSLSNTLTNKKASTGQKIFAGLTGGISNVAYTKKYTNQLETDAKNNIQQQKDLEAQNIAAQQAAQQQQQDYINQQIASQLQNQQTNQFGWGGMMMDHKKMCAEGGELTEYKGQKHEDGGLPLGNFAEVESGETRGLQNTETEDYIFSDRLKVPGRKITFAKASKMIEAKFSKRDNDKLSQNQKELELNKLMNDQEQLRHNMINNVYRKAFGGTMDSTSFGEQKVNTGGNKNSYPVYQNINGVPVKGYVNTTPSAFQNIDRTGTNVIPLQNAQPVSQSEFNANLGTGNYLGSYKGTANLDAVGTNDYRMTSDKAGNKYYWKGTTPISESEYKPKFATGGRIKSYDQEVNDINNTYKGTKYDPLARNVNGIDYNNLYNVGNFIGAGYDIYRGLKKIDPINYERIDPSLVNYEPSRDLIRRDLQSGYNTTVGNIRNVVNNPAQYLSLVTQVAANRDQQLSDAITKSQEAEANANAQIRNQAKYANAQTQRAELDARELAKDNRSNVLSTGLYNAGSAISQLGRDKKAYISQNEAKKLIGTSDYSYEYDSNGKIKGIRFNKTGQVTPIK